MDSFEWNKIAGWVLAAAIAVLGLSIVTGEIYSTAPLEKQAYVVEGVVEEVAAGPAAEAEKPIAFYLASADAAKGEAVFKKCTSCHGIEAGGANAIGPNLHGVLGKPRARAAGFAYSDALKGTAGEGWTFDSMNAWLKSPKTYLPGNKMSFAGLSKPEDRAAVLVYINAQGSNLPLPAAPAEEVAAAPADAPTEGAATPTSEKGAPQAGKAPDVPVATVADQARQPEGNRGGSGAAEVTGSTERDTTTAANTPTVAKAK